MQSNVNEWAGLKLQPSAIGPFSVKVSSMPKQKIFLQGISCFAHCRRR